MMTLNELKETLLNEVQKRDILLEMTPANAKIGREKMSGTYEAVETGKGNEKCLIPQVGTVFYLYRGQNCG